ncbi:MAG: hypothetical protein V3U78_09590 [Thiotrichaceae bacterium]
MTDSHPQAAKLLAYVDGQLNAMESAEVKKLLSQDLTARAFVNQLENSQLPFQEAFDQLLVEDSSNDRPTMPNLTSPTLDTQNTHSQTAWFWPAALAASLVLGLVLGTFIPTQAVKNEQDWIMQVANYQLLYVRDTVKPSQLTQAQITALKQRLETKLASPLIIPDLTQQQLQFKRGQVLDVNGSPLIQLAYLPASGNPVALCITHNQDPDTLPKVGQAHGMPLVHWSQNGLSYVIIGDMDAGELKAAAYNALSQFSNRSDS